MSLWSLWVWAWTRSAATLTTWPHSPTDSICANEPKVFRRPRAFLSVEAREGVEVFTRRHRTGDSRAPGLARAEPNTQLRLTRRCGGVRLHPYGGLPES